MRMGVPVLTGAFWRSGESQKKKIGEEGAIVEENDVEKIIDADPNGCEDYSE